jgi:glycosyltransferase involved in cell wall biosynthesis
MPSRSPSPPRRVAFLMLTYNQASLVRESAMACLAQECEPMDIVFSDDASSDNTYDILQEIASSYAGPHNLIVRRNEKNAGIGEHFNILIETYHNELFIASAGDDISVPTRARALIQAWDNKQQKPELISSHCIRMAYDGTPGQQINTDDLAPVTPTQWLNKRPYIIGATHAFTRRLHTRFGPFSRDLTGEDQIMVFRALCEGGAITVNQALVYYRDGGISRKPSEMSPAEQLAWVRKVNKIDIAEMRQIIKDAETAGYGKQARDRFQDKLDRAYFMRDILAESRFKPMLAVARRHPGISLLWRHKKIITTLFHEPNAVFQKHNQARRQFIRRLRGR